MIKRSIYFFMLFSFISVNIQAFDFSFVSDLRKKLIGESLDKPNNDTSHEESNNVPPQKDDPQSYLSDETGKKILDEHFNAHLKKVQCTMDDLKLLILDEKKENLQNLITHLKLKKYSLKAQKQTHYTLLRGLLESSLAGGCLWAASEGITVNFSPQPLARIPQNFFEKGQSIELGGFKVVQWMAEKLGNWIPEKITYPAFALVGIVAAFYAGSDFIDWFDGVGKYAETLTDAEACFDNLTKKRNEEFLEAIQKYKETLDKEFLILNKEDSYKSYWQKERIKKFGKNYIQLLKSINQEK